MVSNAFRQLHIDELVCISGCIRTAWDHMERDGTRFRHHIGMSCDSAEILRKSANMELRSRPEYPDEVEPWAESPSLENMSIDVISKLSTEELLCISNCIKMALECYDWDFHLLISETREFAQVFKTALDMELAKRPGRKSH